MGTRESGDPKGAARRHATGGRLARRVAPVRRCPPPSPVASITHAMGHRAGCLFVDRRSPACPHRPHRRNASPASPLVAGVRVRGSRCGLDRCFGGGPDRLWRACFAVRRSGPLHALRRPGQLRGDPHRAGWRPPGDGFVLRRTRGDGAVDDRQRDASPGHRRHTWTAAVSARDATARLVPSAAHRPLGGAELRDRDGLARNVPPAVWCRQRCDRHRVRVVWHQC